MSISTFPFAVSPYILALCLASSAFGKGLDTLQADADKTPAASTKGWGADKEPAQAPTPTSDSVPSASSIQPAVQTQAPPLVSTVAEAERLYLATSFSWINLSGSEGDWSTGATGDVEAGYKFLALMQKFDLFGTLRYRPVEAVIRKDQREYRGIVETYLVGAKVRMSLNPKLTVNASAELGTSQTHLNPSDTIPTVDQSLEKSGVDLNLGGGVSYLVLDKFAVGGKLALGTGAYKSVQIGVDLRFML